MGEKGDAAKVLSSIERKALNILKSRNSAPIGWWSYHADSTDPELQTALAAMSAKLVVKGEMQLDEAKRWLPKLKTVLTAKVKKWRETLALVQEDAAALKAISGVSPAVLMEEDLDEVVKAVPGRVAKVKEKIKKYRELEGKIAAEGSALKKYKWSQEAQADLTKIHAGCKDLLKVLQDVDSELDKAKSNV